MKQVSIRVAEAKDAERLNAALARLSSDLGDHHRATPETLRQAGWGPHPAIRACLAEDADHVVGATLYSPYFSTARGGAGVYVSDLWVAPELRGQSLGQRLLAATFDDAAATWDAVFLKLNVYHSSHDARRFYDRLGFVPADTQTEMVLGPDGCATLRSPA